MRRGLRGHGNQTLHEWRRQVKAGAEVGVGVGPGRMRSCLALGPHVTRRKLGYSNMTHLADHARALFPDLAMGADRVRAGADLAIDGLLAWGTE